MSNLIHIFACGGCGINVAHSIVDNLKALGDGFSRISDHYIDTSSNDIFKVKNGDAKFHQIKSKSLSKEHISGSGGERATHAKDIEENVKKYIDELGIKKTTGEYAVVMFSASGGSGNVIGTYLINNLFEKDIPTVAVVIGDSTSILYTMNTHKAIKSLDGTAKKARKPLSVIYINNEAYASSGLKQAIVLANKSIFNSLSALSLFLSGDNHSLDAQDMINMIDQSKYTTLNIPVGLYGLNGFSKEIVIPDGCVGTGVRTLYNEGESPDINFVPWHHKYGAITEENVLNKYGAMTPIHLVSYTNFFTTEMKRLDKQKQQYLSTMNSVEIDEISNDDETDDDGMAW